MRKRGIVIAAIVMSAMLAACGTKTVEENNAAKEQTVEESAAATEESTADSTEESVSAEEEKSSEAEVESTAEETTEETDENADATEADTELNNDSAKLPSYEYPGPEQFYSALYAYLTDELGSGFSGSDVTIPCPIIIHEDESDDNDIRVYGDFWIFNYELKGDTLECTSGGSFPGCVHLKKAEAGYEVTGMDRAEDGSEFESSAKKIFGDYYEAYTKAADDTVSRDSTRAQIIANYVAANGLAIKSYKDFGWDPVTLPEENIDSFYSVLD